MAQRSAIKYCLQEFLAIAAVLVKFKESEYSDQDNDTISSFSVHLVMFLNHVITTLRHYLRPALDYFEPSDTVGYTVSILNIGIISG